MSEVSSTKLFKSYPVEMLVINNSLDFLQEVLRLLRKISKTKFIKRNYYLTSLSSKTKLLQKAIIYILNQCNIKLHQVDKLMYAVIYIFGRNFQ